MKRTKQTSIVLATLLMAVTGVLCGCSKSGQTPVATASDSTAPDTKGARQVNIQAAPPGVQIGTEGGKK
jgi:hypothetical protein